MDTEKRLDAQVRPARDPREKDRMRRAREDIEKFIKNNIIEGLIERAHAYGESLEVCKTIQKKFEMRPVTKYVYPLLPPHYISQAGIMPKSITTINSLG